MCSPSARKEQLKATYELALSDLVTEIARKCRMEGHPPEWPIDTFCSSAASELCKSLSLASQSFVELEHVSWVVGQYRGTAVSGERNIADFWSNAKLGSKGRALAMLHYYWRAYGLGSSIGELFSGQLRSVLRESTSWSKSQVEWAALRVEVSETGTVDNLQFLPGWQDGGCVRKLTIPRRWLDIAVPSQVFSRIVSSLDRLDSVDARSLGVEVEKCLEEGLLRRQLARHADHLVAEALAIESLDGDSPSSRNAVAFVGNVPMSAELAMRRVVRAIQVLGLLWRWNEASGHECGDLVVLCPVPVTTYAVEIPRVGLAMLFLKKECVTDQLVTELCGFLNETLVTTLLQFATTWKRVAIAAKGSLERSGAEVFGTEVWRAIFAAVVDGRLGSESDAILLLSKLVPVISEVCKLLPSFVHEGRRYAVNLVIGVPYHEQVLGRRLAELSQEKHAFLGYFQTGDEVGVLGPLVESSYSIMDSQDVALFGCFSRTISWRSLIRLHPCDDHVGEVRRYEALTGGHGNLFAVSVTRDGKVRLFGGGRVLGELWKSRWLFGAGTERLVSELARHLAAIGLPGVSPADLRQFAALLQRISEAPGIGALFVVSTHSEEVTALKRMAEPPRELWQGKTLRALLEEPHDTLYRLAITDGATGILVGSQGSPGERWSKSQVFPRRLLFDPYDYATFAETFRGDVSKTIGFGSRRASGIAKALRRHDDMPACLCVIVSADGPIYLTQGGELTELPDVRGS